MNIQTMLDELASDLESSITKVKKEKEHWGNEGLTASVSCYQRQLNLYEKALTKVFEIKELLTAIERGF